MKNMMKQIAMCATISGLFVLAVFAQRQVGLLGPETSRVALATAAVLPPESTDVVIVKDGPIFPPPPIDIPSLNAGLKDGPIFPPPPIDIPSRKAGLKDGPIFPPPPIDIPSLNAGLKDGPIFPPPPIDIPSRKAGLKDGPIFPPPPIDIPRS